ncbi:MAG: hypothetical protein A2452_06375 [Candidatus Firestonebacteria bacterium RIFOXYC2_FULL_39_67]|nr:MAG: hypothetical protein A2452_06375 [Candidatus Firestonebacteria bacterium RIFOXYC2_FULL_39_67]
MIILRFLLVSMIFAGTMFPDSQIAITSASRKPRNVTDYRELKFLTIEGKETNLAAFSGKVVLIVNVASKCGYTKQYKELVLLHKMFKDKGFVVIGFPSNDFGGQEPGTNVEIKEFCLLNYSVDFPMMAKVSVTGKESHPLFTWIREDSPLPGKIEWNFFKFLFDKKGNLVERWPSNAAPLHNDISAKIEKILQENTNK